MKPGDLSDSRERLRAQVKAAQDAKPFPEYPRNGSLRHCRRAKWFGGGIIHCGVAQLEFGVEGEAEPIYLLLSERDMRIIASSVAESQNLTKVQSDKSSGSPAFDGSPEDGQKLLPLTKSSKAWGAE